MLSAQTLIMLALLPAALIIIYIYRMDKVEKEPWRLIFKLMALGAVSVIPVSFMELFMELIGPAYSFDGPNSLPAALYVSFASAALCEELAKFFFLRVGSWNHPEFGYRFDGIVYGVAVALGFAAIENVEYVLMYGFETAIIRGLMAVPLHAFCGVYMGIFYGAAKQASIRGYSTKRHIALALGVPIMIHGIYDTMCFLGVPAASIVLDGFVIVLYIVSIRYIRKFSRDDWKSGFYPETRPLSDMGGGFGGAGSSVGNGSTYNYGSSYGRTTNALRPRPGEIYNGKIILVCPRCRGGLQVPAGKGRIRIQCPHCGERFFETT